MKLWTGCRVSILFTAMALIAVQPALALEYPLTSTDIREAYFLGAGSPGKREAFLAQYRRNLPVPPAGPRISVIGIETPFAAVVERAEKAFNYHAPDAEEEFLGKPGSFHVYVRIDFTASYGAQAAAPDGGYRQRPDDFWKDFTVRLSQAKKEISASSLDGTPLYESGDEGGSWLVGAAIKLTYDLADIDPAKSATIDVLTPDGQDVQVKFDLAKLR